MTLLRFTDYAHDSYERAETVERLTEKFGWPRSVAEAYAAVHQPMGEVEGTFDYDPETGSLTVVEAVIEGVRLVPAREDS